MNGKFSLDRKYLPLMITISLFIGLYLYGAIQYRGFASPQVFLNLLIDNSFLLITSIGMTFVILSGGIDLSVGAVIAFTTVFSAYMLEDLGLSPAIVIPAVLLFGVALGAVMGAIVQGVGQTKLEGDLKAVKPPIPGAQQQQILDAFGSGSPPPAAPARAA